MRKDELIKLVKELNELPSLQGRENDIFFIKKEASKLNSREDFTYADKLLTDEFFTYYDALAAKAPELNRSSLEDKKIIINKAKELLSAEGNERNLLKEIDTLFLDFKHLPKCTEEQDNELFGEFKCIKEEAKKKVDTYYASIKSSFLEKKTKKEELISKAKEALNMENMKQATSIMDNLMEEWKKVGFAGKECDEDLWNEFSALRKEFSVKRKEYFEHLKDAFVERAAKKEELIKKVKYITSEAYFTPEEVKEIKDIEKEFRNLGFAGKEKDQILWDEMQAAIKKYFEEMKFYK